MTPLVSILIPAYNVQAYIADTLRSALAQSWPRTEIIVVDDGSTDGTSDILASLASTALRVVRQENQGAAVARNLALSLAQGDFIQWLDADDLLSRDKITSQVRVLREIGDPRALASCGWAHFRCRPQGARLQPGPLWTDLAPVEWMLRKWETNSHMQTATWLVSRELTDRAGPWHTTMSNDDDGEYFARIVLNSSRVAFVPDARVYYRVTPGNRLSDIGRSPAKVDSLLRGMALQIALLRSMRDDTRVRDACTTYLQTWLAEIADSPMAFERVRTLVEEWGGTVHPPRVSPRYAWIALALGVPAARATQRRYNRLKSDLLRKLDHVRLLAEGGAVDVHSL